MGRLADAILRGVASARDALGDDALSVVLTKKTKQPYIAGHPQEYSTVNHQSKGIYSAYDHKEIDGNMIQLRDVKAVIFPFEGGVIPEANDEMVLGDEKMRVIRNQPIRAGSEIALHVVQARPVA